MLVQNPIIDAFVIEVFWCWCQSFNLTTFKLSIEHIFLQINASINIIWGLSQVYAVVINFRILNLMVAKVVFWDGLLWSPRPVKCTTFISGCDTQFFRILAFFDLFEKNTWFNPRTRGSGQIAAFFRIPVTARNGATMTVWNRWTRFWPLLSQNRFVVAEGQAIGNWG